MGLESANYLMVPADGVDGVTEELAAQGASRRSPFPAGGFERWVLRSTESWIDVMVGDLGPERKPAISIRISLSNPVKAHAHLRKVMSALLSRVPGTIFDKQTRNSYEQIDDDAWREIESALSQKRAEFQRNFGPFEAAISGEDVFPTLRGRD